MKRALLGFVLWAGLCGVASAVPIYYGNTVNSPLQWTPIAVPTGGVVVGFGASWTSGSGASSCPSSASFGVSVTPTGTCYLEKLGEDLGVNVINVGVSGTCTGSYGTVTNDTYCTFIGRAGITRYLTDLVPNCTASNVIVFDYAGINEVYHQDQLATPAAYRAALDTMIAACIAAGTPSSQIIIETTAHETSPALNAFQKTLIQQLSTQNVLEAVARNTYIAPIYEKTLPCWADYLPTPPVICTSDGLHPNDYGANIVALAMVGAVPGPVFAGSIPALAGYSSSLGGTSLGAASGQSLTLSGNSTVGGNSSVTGNETVSGNSTVGGSVTAGSVQVAGTGNIGVNSTNNFSQTTYNGALTFFNYGGNQLGTSLLYDGTFNNVFSHGSYFPNNDEAAWFTYPNFNFPASPAGLTPVMVLSSSGALKAAGSVSVPGTGNIGVNSTNNFSSTSYNGALTFFNYGGNQLGTSLLYDGAIGSKLSHGSYFPNNDEAAWFTYPNGSFPTTQAGLTPVMALSSAGNLKAAGTIGINGASGPTWSSGSGAPTGACVSGSFYTNTTSSAANTTAYACRASAWFALTGG